MNRNNVWRFVLVSVVILWSAYELYPPRGMDLVQYFRERAVNQDATFKAIVQKAQGLEKAAPEKAYDSLFEAIGTNDITRYFPFFESKTEAHPTTYILNRLQREPKAAGRIRLGLDLKGGTSFLVEMDTSSLTNTSDSSGALSQAVEVLRKRVDKFGVAEPVIQPEGNNRILVQLPGLSAADQENARIAIKKAAFLEFKIVHEDSKNLVDQGIIPPGYQLMTQVKTLPNGAKQLERYMVKKRAEMVGGIKSAMVTRDNLGRPEIAFTLDSAHADEFGRITTENVGRQLAVILDGELQTAPVIRTAITGGSGVIEGDYSQQEAFQLQNVLENPLKTPLDIKSSRVVDPTLGKDSIRSGVRAAVYGTLAVSAFMLVYYMIAGMVAIDFTRPRSVARQMRWSPSKTRRAAASPPFTRNDIRCP